MDSTIGSVFFERVKRFKDQLALKYKTGSVWLDISWGDFGQKVEMVAYGLSALSIKPADRVAILSENRPEWALCDLGIISIQAITVPIYHTNKSKQIEYILNDSGAKILIVSKLEMLQEVLLAGDNLKFLKQIIIIDDHKEWQEKTSLDLLSFQKLLDLGKDFKTSKSLLLKDLLAGADKDQPVSFVYTSGTTGNPKGVILTHENFLSNARACLKVIDIQPGNICLSFLPLSHVLERMAGYYLMLYRGVTIAYAESISKVPENLAEVKPDVMVSVPRLYEKIYASIIHSVNQGGSFKKKIFLWSVEIGKNYTQNFFREKNHQ